MRWDDLQLLRLIDELETSEQAGHLMSGYNLIQAASAGRAIDWGRDEMTFARELLLARGAGYLEWTDQLYPNRRQADPITDAHQWLQEIRDLRLTIPGRDRARGLVIQRPLPDPDEDDDRPITGMTLEEIARDRRHLQRTAAAALPVRVRHPGAIHPGRGPSQQVGVRARDL